MQSPFLAKNSCPLIFLELQTDGRWKAWLEGENETSVFRDSLAQVDSFFHANCGHTSNSKYLANCRLQETYVCLFQR
jgi:hypothetical protein